MALTNDEKNFIFQYSQQLLNQDFLTSSYLQGSTAGKSLRDMMLAKQPVQPLTNPFEEAMTGSLRADSAAVKQNARNLVEAANMMGTAKNGVAQMADVLNDMLALIQDVQDGKLDGSSAIVQGEYDEYITQLNSVIHNTEYNGINMLDSAKWGTNQIDSGGSVWIQAMKEGGFNVTFNAMNSLDNMSDLSSTNLNVNAAAQKAFVNSLKNDVDAVLTRYTSKQSSLVHQASLTESQGIILDQAVENRMGSTLSVEQILLNLILGDTGRIVDSSS